MADTRVQKRQIRTRIKLLESAHILMSENGVGTTTIQGITVKADIGFGTFYSYFSSKDEIAEAVLDCVIQNLGLRNRQANIDADISDPVMVIANSVRLTAQEMMNNPMWRWWLRRPDLMVHRMNVGFRPFGLEDMRIANEQGLLNPPSGSVDFAWNCLIWLLAGTIIDISEGKSARQAESSMTEAIMRILGVEFSRAMKAARAELPRYPEIPIDFSFELKA